MDLLLPAQCRAARALLNWSQPDLAQRAGIHIQTICAFESENSTPTKTTLSKLTTAFENEGLVFTPQGGVNPNVSGIIRYEGKFGFMAFMDDVYDTARKYGGDICLFNSKPKLWYEWLGEEWYQAHAKRMAALGSRIKVRITVQEGEDFFILGIAEHRWFKRDLWKEKVIYVYGPKLAFLDFSDSNVRIMVLNQSEFSDSVRVLYDIAWETATSAPEVVT